MNGPRAPMREELPQILDFLKTKLRKDSGWTIAEEYPTAFGPNNAHNLCIITEENKILSHAVIKPLIIKTPVAIFKAAPIGSVVTDEAHRNKGLSQQVLKECINKAIEQQCDFAVLWTDLYDFYRKLGFELAGTELSYFLDRALPVPEEATLRIVEGAKIDPQALLKLYSKHTVASIRTANEIKKCLKIPNTRIYTAWGMDNQLKAYAIEGKGADLKGYVHEWGGSVPALVELFSHVIRTKKEALTVIVPKHAQGLRRALEPLCQDEHQGYLGMIKILRPHVLTEKAQKAARSLGVKGLEIRWEKDQLQVRLGEESASIEDGPDLVRLFFGPETPENLFKNQGPLRDALTKVFPLPLWIWGWDSI